MVDDGARAGPGFRRLSTGIAGLDAILGGGLFEGGLYVLQGAPGTGKTILANQICYHRVSEGERAAYVTLPGEAHDRLLRHIGALGFADLSKVPGHLSYLSAFGELSEGGLPAALAMICDLLRRREPAFLVLEGLYVAREHAASDNEFRTFVHVLQGLAGQHGCTMLFTTKAAAAEPGPELPLADGLIELHDDLVTGRAVRSLEVTKLRGSAFLRGRHVFRITDEGIRAFPRLETLVRPTRNVPPASGKISIGVDDLDRMMLGGIPAGSTTLLAGPSGSGKTTLGLLFLARATPEEPALLFGCYEAPEEIRMKAASLGIAYDAMVASGALEVVWHPPMESFLDETGERLLAAARRTGARRIFVDGIGAFRQVAVHPGRLNAFLTALSIILRSHQITTVFAGEARGLLTLEDLVVDEVSPIAENIVLMRFAEYRSRLLRMMSILKIRQSDFDPSIVPFEITGTGILLQPPLKNAEAIMRGTVHRNPRHGAP